MKRCLKKQLFFGLLFICLCFGSLDTGQVIVDNDNDGQAVYAPTDTVYITIGINIFRNCFKEPFETMYFLMNTGLPIAMSIHDTRSCGVSAPFVNRYLKSKDLKVSDISIVIHNHPSGILRFSHKDIIFLNDLKRYGFTGTYLLWANGRIKPYEGN